MDDLLDYEANTETLGKPVLEDVRQGVYSLPLIYALNQAPQQLRPYLEKKKEMTDDDTLHVQQLVHQLGGVAYAQQLATKYTEQALKDIRKKSLNA